MGWGDWPKYRGAREWRKINPFAVAVERTQPRANSHQSRLSLRSTPLIGGAHSVSRCYSSHACMSRLTRANAGCSMPSALDLLSAAALLEEEANSSATPSEAPVDVAEIARQALGFPVPPSRPPPPPPPLEYVPYRYPPPPPPASAPTSGTSLPPLPTLPLPLPTPRPRAHPQSQPQSQPQPQFFTTASGSAKLALPSLPPLPLHQPAYPPIASDPPAAHHRIVAAPPPPRPTEPVVPTTRRARSPPAWTLPPDLGLIRCVCPYTFDDGFTIQCDLCNAWQHAGCVGIASEEQVPDEYQCERCDPEDARRRGVSRDAAERGMRERVREMARVQQAGGLRVGPPSGPSTLMQLGKAIVPTPVLNSEEPTGRRKSFDITPTGGPTARTARGAAKPRRSANLDDPTYVPSSTTVASLPPPPPPPMPSASSTAPIAAAPPLVETDLPTSASGTATATNLPPTSVSLAAPGQPAVEDSAQGSDSREESATPGPPPVQTNPNMRTTAVGRKRRVAKQPRKGSAQPSTTTESNDVEMDDASHPSPRATSEPDDDSATPRRPAQPQPLTQPQSREVANLAPTPRLSALGLTRAQVSAATQPSSRHAPLRDDTTSEEDEDEGRDTPRGGPGRKKDKYEPWQYEFTSISSNLFADQAVSDKISALLSKPPTSILDDIDDAPLRPRQSALRRRQLAARSRTGPASKSALLSHLLDHPSYTPVPTLPPSLPLLVKPLPSSSYHLNPPISTTYLPTSYSSSLHASSAAAQSLCPYPRPTTHAVYATSSIPAGTFITPVRGEIKSIESYRRDPINQYDLLGTLKAGVRSLAEPWSLVVDGRKWGNETRFIRSGCHPNAIMKVIKVETEHDEHKESLAAPASTAVDLPSRSSRSRSSTPLHWSAQKQRPPTTESNSIDISSRFVLAVYSLVDISKREEIVLPWDWDDLHLIHLVPSLLSLPSAPPLPTPLVENEQGVLEVFAKKLALSLDSILASSVPGGCACDKKRDCAVWWACRGAATTVKSLTARSTNNTSTGGGGGGRNGIDSGDLVDQADPGTFKDKDREPFRAMFMNALNPGVVTNGGGHVSQEGVDPSSAWRSRKKGGGHTRKWPELGPLVGFERGWIVKELDHQQTFESNETQPDEDEIEPQDKIVVDTPATREENLIVDVEFDSPLSDLAELEPEPVAMDLDDDETKVEFDGLKVAGKNPLPWTRSSS